MDELGDGLLRLAMMHSPVGMMLVSPDGRMLAVNDAVCAMLDRDHDELLQSRWQDVTHPDDLAIDADLTASVLAGERSSYRLSKRYLRKDGELVWGDLSVALVRDDDGTPLYFVSQILDVTEQRRADQLIADANAVIDKQTRAAAAIFDAVDVGLVLIDKSGRYEQVNRRHLDFMALAYPEGHHGMAGQTGEVYEADGETLMARQDLPSYRATAGEEFDDVRAWVGSDPATRRALSVSARSTRNPDGTLAGAALAYKDVTEFMRALSVKDEFVASVSHELRTPLTSVLGHLELLGERDDLTEEVAAQLRVVQRNAARLQALLSDLLLIGQIADGTLELQSAALDLTTVVEDAVEAVRVVADQSGVMIRTEAPETLPVVADGRRLRQVLDNLLSNAIKYGRAGGSVTVALRRVGDGVELDVADTGMGIADDEREHVFGRFFRGGEAVRQHLPGTGLGLSIVASIVAAHGGTVTVESELGQGSTFRVALPGVVHQP
jgi:two-component system, OmpR family, phosphate regulon sensor histidine kinase PhoR